MSEESAAASAPAPRAPGTQAAPFERMKHAGAELASATGDLLREAWRDVSGRLSPGRAGDPAPPVEPNPKPAAPEGKAAGGPGAGADSGNGAVPTVESPNRAVADLGNTVAEAASRLTEAAGGAAGWALDQMDIARRSELERLRRRTEALEAQNGPGGTETGRG